MVPASVSAKTSVANNEERRRDSASKGECHIFGVLKITNT
jgi:hypothetical protein